MFYLLVIVRYGRVVFGLVLTEVKIKITGGDIKGVFTTKKGKKRERQQPNTLSKM